MRHVPQEHAKRAALRSYGVVLARPQRGPAQVRRSVLRRTPGSFLAFQLVGTSARRLRRLSAKSWRRVTRPSVESLCGSVAHSKPRVVRMEADKAAEPPC